MQNMSIDDAPEILLSGAFGLAIGTVVAVTSNFGGQVLGAAFADAVSNPETYIPAGTVAKFGNVTTTISSSLLAINNIFRINGNLTSKSFNSGVVLSSVVAATYSYSNL